MNEREQEALRRRLLTYPGATPETVDQQLEAYEERNAEKQALMNERSMSNAMAETFLDKKGYPRPPGWRNVFFYPGASRPRNGYVVAVLIVLVLVVFFVL